MVTGFNMRALWFNMRALSPKQISTDLSLEIFKKLEGKDDCKKPHLESFNMMVP